VIRRPPNPLRLRDPLEGEPCKALGVGGLAQPEDEVGIDAPGEVFGLI
jgi:hypothetical protein